MTKKEGKDKIISLSIIGGIALFITIAIILIISSFNSDESQEEVVEKSHVESTVVVYSDSGKKIHTYEKAYDIVTTDNVVEFDYTDKSYVKKHAKVINATVIIQ